MIAAPSTPKVTLPAEMLEALDAQCPVTPITQKPSKYKADLRYVRVGDPIAICPKDDTGEAPFVDKVRFVNANLLQTEAGFRFSRTSGRAAHHSFKHLIAKPVEGYPYSSEVASFSTQLLPKSDKITESRRSKRPGVNEGMEFTVRMRNHLRNRSHFWFDAVFVEAEWKKSFGKGKMKSRLNSLSLMVVYEIVRGPLDGWQRTFYIPVVRKAEQLEAAMETVVSCFRAEGLEPEDGDEIGAELMNATLGDRPVRLHIASRDGRLGQPTEVKFMDNEWIETHLGWEVTEDGSAFEPDVLPETNPEY